MTCSTASKSGTYFAGSADGRIIAYSDARDGTAITLSGEPHSGYVSGIASTPNSIWSVGYDDRVREITTSADGKEFKSSAGTATIAQPKAVAAGGDLAFVAQSNTIEVFKNGAKSFSSNVKYEATTIAVSNAGTVAIGGQVGWCMQL